LPQLIRKIRPASTTHYLTTCLHGNAARKWTVTIQVSFDDGRTWPEKYHLLLDEGRGRGYPSISRVDDRHVGIVYEGSQADLVFEKLSLDELLRPR